MDFSALNHDTSCGTTQRTLMHNFYKDADVTIRAYTYELGQVCSADSKKSAFNIVTDEDELDFFPTSLNVQDVMEHIKKLCGINEYIAVDLLDGENSHCFILYLDQDQNMKIIDSYIGERVVEVRDFSLEKFCKYLCNNDNGNDNAHNAHNAAQLSCELFNCQDPIYLANWILIIGYFYRLN